MGFYLPGCPSKAHTEKIKFSSHPYVRMEDDVEKGQQLPPPLRSQQASQRPSQPAKGMSPHHRTSDSTNYYMVCFISFIFLICLTWAGMGLGAMSFNERLDKMDELLSHTNHKLDAVTNSIGEPRTAASASVGAVETKPILKPIVMPELESEGKIKRRRRGLTRRADLGVIPTAEDMPSPEDVPNTLYDVDGRERHGGGFEPVAPPWFYEHDTEGWGWPNGPWDELKKPISGSRTWAEYPNGPNQEFDVGA